MSDEKQFDWKAVLAKAKVIGIIACCSILVCGACFFGGYKYSEYRINKEGTSAASKLRVDLDNTKSALDAANADLTAANNRVAELESGIDGALQLAEQSGQSLESIRQQTNNIGSTSSDLREIYRQLCGNQQAIRKSVEQLQSDNSELKSRLSTVRREDAGQ